MRQVTYSRPKDWVDPFTQTESQAIPTSPKKILRPSTVCSSSPSRYSTRTQETNKSHGKRGNSHINRLKHLRQSNSASNPIITSIESISLEQENQEKIKKEYEENDVKEEIVMSDIDKNEDYEDDDNFDEETGLKVSLLSFFSFFLF